VDGVETISFNREQPLQCVGNVRGPKADHIRCLAGKNRTKASLRRLLLSVLAFVDLEDIFRKRDDDLGFEK